VRTHTATDEPVVAPEPKAPVARPLSAEPWQSRLVDDHVRELEAAEADSELMWTVLREG
jgi:hypothetical protein